MRRFFRLGVERDRLAGGIGCGGRVRIAAYKSAAEAQEALLRWQRIKERRGFLEAIERFELEHSVFGIDNYHERFLGR